MLSFWAADVGGILLLLQFSEKQVSVHKSKASITAEASQLQRLPVPAMRRSVWGSEVVQRARLSNSWLQLPDSDFSGVAVELIQTLLAGESHQPLRTWQRAGQTINTKVYSLFKASIRTGLFKAPALPSTTGGQAWVGNGSSEISGLRWVTTRWHCPDPHPHPCPFSFLFLNF